MGFTQCHRCQQYGHSSINCGKQYRCIKCIANHEPGQCTRKTREGSPQCCNCKLAHASNSKLCIFFIKYKEKITNFKKPLSSTHQNTPAPLASQNADNSQLIKNQENFPQLSNNIPTIQQENYKKTIENNNIHDFSQFFKDQNDFANIPNIKVSFTLFNKMVNELKSAPEHGARMSIMMRYSLPIE